MDDLDWEFDKPEIIFRVVVYVALVSVLLIAVGYLLHLGWDLFGS